MNNFRIEDATQSHVGHVRSVNEDSQVSLAAAGIWLVADGMGGFSNGDYASQAIAAAVRKVDPGEDLEGACTAVANAIHATNAEIFARSQELGKQMGSTVVALVVRGHEFAVLWVGDSRAYVFRDGQLIQLTRDHTQVVEMVDRGLLTPEEARDHPMSHVLSRAVGVQPSLEIDAVGDTIVSRDIFVLCTDGLYGVVSEEAIADILRRQGPDSCDELIAACLAGGAPDNVTVTLVAASEPTLLALNGVAT
jgi:serine/threonine protein phosphatase PrpC